MRLKRWKVRTQAKNLPPFSLLWTKSPRESKALTQTLTLTTMATSSALANLEDVLSVDLMSELLRRFKCSDKPDKRLILVGIHIFIYLRKYIHMRLLYSIISFPSVEMLALDNEILSDPRMQYAFGENFRCFQGFYCDSKAFLLGNIWLRCLF